MGKVLFLCGSIYEFTAFCLLSLLHETPLLEFLKPVFQVKAKRVALLMDVLCNALLPI
ncbi:hypothetical protein SLEP1_g52450 [Rubroshorea leprosula]|uniref:Uncharacterized protein n=1 Tax=Rubroshorea leprosula TaxID=152421 RepID=A0AAV5M6A8_9ROSI|nr:hypothetical protein SLEP1_g52450 [Rubroshorea leprosula]